MALSAARDLFQSRGDITGKTDEFLMAASTTIYKGAYVMLDANGLAVPAAAAAGAHGIIGVALETVTSDASNPSYIAVQWGEMYILSSGMAQARVGEFAYASDDETAVADASAATNTLALGQIKKYVSATKVLVDVDPAISAQRGLHA